MTYTAYMNPDMEQEPASWEQELDSLLVAYGSESFTRSILQVYTRDCPAAVQKLLRTIDAGDLEQARNAIHSLSNIMGVVGPASSRPLIDGITIDLQNDQREAAAKNAKKLDVLVKAVLIGINAWLEGLSRKATFDRKEPRSNA